MISLVVLAGGSYAQKLKGSDTMLPLSQKEAETFMKEGRGNVTVTGGGSGVGFTALIDGTTEIAQASRAIKMDEKLKLTEAGISYKEVIAAYDALAMVVNPSNSINELTREQLEGIYTGKIKNWKEVGGADADIKLYGRENSSGTYVFFQENVVKGDYASSCQTLPGTAAVVNAVKNDKYGIGYGGAAYSKGIKQCLVKKDDKSQAYAPSTETIKNGTYPISRYLYMYLRNRPTGEMKNYIDWILGPEGQKLVVEQGYFPVK